MALASVHAGTLWTDALNQRRCQWRLPVGVSRAQPEPSRMSHGSGPALSTKGICPDEAVPFCRGVQCPGS